MVGRSGSDAFRSVHRGPGSQRDFPGRNAQISLALTRISLILEEMDKALFDL